MSVVPPGARDGNAAARARRRCVAPAPLAAALLSATALVGVPLQIHRAAARDFASAPGAIQLVVFAAGLLLFTMLSLLVLPIPGRARSCLGAVLCGLAAYAWARSWFFPGPSLNLDGSAVAADLSTGWAGLVVPLAAGALLAGLASRRPRDASAVVAVLLAGSLAESLVAGASAWRTKRADAGAALAMLQEWSSRGNVLVIVLDSLQSDVLEDALRAEPRLVEGLEGFRHYRLASSNEPTTYLSLPTLHGGRPYEPGQSAAEFYREAVYEGSVLNRLAGAGYRTSYAVNVGDCPRAVAACAAPAQLARSWLELAVSEAAPLLDLGIYRVLPDGLRAGLLRQAGGPVALLTRRAAFERGVVEAAALERLASASTVTASPPTAKIFHSMVTHLPAVLQPDCSPGERRFDREAAVLQARCALRRVVHLLDRLRGDGTYDVTSIALVADHGYGFESAFAARSEDPKFRRMVGALNPAVLVKPAMARGPLTASDAPVELADVPRALCGDAGCSPAEGLRALGAVDAGRTRAAFWYTWSHRYWDLPEIPGIARYSIRGDLPAVESWSRSASVYAPGTVIQFRRGGNVGEYVGFGWGRRQSTHTSMADPEATLWLKGTFEPGRDYALVVETEAADAAARAPKGVAVAVNDVELGRIAPVGSAPGVQTHRFAVPASVLSGSLATVIRFSAEPGSEPGGAEARLAVRTLELKPAR